MARGMPMIATPQIRWGRIAVAALLSEVAVILLLIVSTTVFRFLIAPGRTEADYSAFGDRAGYYLAPVGAGVATFLGALWVGRKLTSRFVANGTLVGAVAVVLTGGLLFVANPQDRLMYGVSYVIRIVEGYSGGVVARHRSDRQLRSVPNFGRPGEETT